MRPKRERLTETHRAWRAAPANRDLREQYMAARERVGLNREPELGLPFPSRLEAAPRVLGARPTTRAGKPKKSMSVPEAEAVIKAWLRQSGWEQDRHGSTTKDVWINNRMEPTRRVSFKRRNVVFERGGRGAWHRDMRIHRWGDELLTKAFAEQIVNESQAAQQAYDDPWAPNPPMGDWYAQAVKGNEEALRVESSRGLPPASSPPGSIVMPDGSRYMTLSGDWRYPSQGLLLWRPDGLEGVMVEPVAKGRVRIRQGTVNVRDELAVTRPQGWELTLAVLDMIERSATERRGPISQWALGVVAQPARDMVNRYGIDAIGRDWEVTIPAQDSRILKVLSKQGVS